MQATASPTGDETAAAYRAQLALATSPPDDASTAVRLGDALRRLAQVTVGTKAPDGLLARLAAEAERWADELEPHAAGTRFEQTERVGGPTRRLSVRYRRPTPLNTALRYEAGIESVEDRVTRLSGRLMAGDIVCAEGSGEVARSGLRRPDGGA